MSPDPRSLAERISAETGLEFSGREGRDSDGTRWLALQPAGYPPGQTFTLRTLIGWRRLDVHFQPGNFAGDLMSAMGSADETGRRTFRTILDVCREEDAEVALTINGANCLPDDSAIWETGWRSFGLGVRKGMLAINEGNVEEDMRQIELWTSRVAAAVLALLPLEVEDEGLEASPEVIGLPEGAKVRVETNRYERDRRNRAAALAIHGYSCKACKLDMSERYGAAASGLIEVHHVTPVSQLGEDYIIDPRTDLVPLCPNCHSVSHRRTPPYSVDDLREMLASVPETV
ncbi:HNH endonuclease (plasmid) [Agrobacterium sp. 13-2099-1-2]|uniref:HNH endonuclease n=1 Tax=Agrobacterium sp. 13-2099-1-2 TaxID=1841651 RepID=UPI00081001D5|nr:HNH endonuclease [Agrobacterium sp. 13-2099-1-2]UZX45223.1 HNH endonuclease [Agrobacterium sp. 13-2099-1-2]